LPLAAASGPAYAQALRCEGIASHLAHDLTAAHRHLSESLALYRTWGNPFELACTLLALGVTNRDLGDYPAALHQLAESRLVWQQLDHPWGLYLVTMESGQVAVRQGKYGQAAADFSASLNQARRLGEDWCILYALHNLLVLKRTQGDAEGAQGHYQEIRILHARLPVRAPQLHALAGMTLSAYALGNVAPWSAYFVGDYATAEQWFAEQLAHSRAHGDQLLTAWLLNHLGDVVRAQGKLPHAAALYQESQALFDSLENPGGAALPLHNLGYVWLHTGAVSEALAAFVEALQRNYSAGLIWNVADCLIGVAAVAQAQGEPARAAYLLGAAAHMHDTVDVSGAYASPTTRQEEQRLMALVRDQLSPAAWAAAYSAGGQLTMAETINAALGNG
jgi:tetratricopeptide (TPR) repeat protein